MFRKILVITLLCFSIVSYGKTTKESIVEQDTGNHFSENVLQKAYLYDQNFSFKYEINEKEKIFVSMSGKAFKFYLAIRSENQFQFA